MQQPVRRAPRAWLSSVISLADPCGRPTAAVPVIGSERSGTGIAPHEVRPERVEYQVRAARITDIERLVALYDDALRASHAGDPDRPLAAADLLRQLVYLPQATILVAESRREVVGGAILALRPSVRAGGFVGTVDLLVVDPEHQDVGIAEALIEELLRSARNKGCVAVEAVQPDDPAERSRWDRYGFGESAPKLERLVAAERASARRG